jgi:ClpP class serine protease
VAHELLRLREKLCNTPHLIHPTSFETIIDYLDKRCEDGEVGEPIQGNSRYSYNQDMQVAVLNIDGPLTYKPVTMMGFDCGGTSYQQLKEDFTYLVESGAKTIAFHVSSGGGEAHQMIDSAKYMKKLAEENDVKTLAYVDGLSASAAYGLSVIADEIIMANGSEVGSIGVVVRLMNDSKALEKEGIERIFVTAGSSKVPFAEDGSFRKGFLDDLQMKVDTLYKEFTEFVAENRSLSVEAVRSTEAKTFLPEDALRLGLADNVMNLEEFYSYLADSAQRKETVLKTQLFNMGAKASEQKEKMNMNLEEMQAKLSAFETEMSTIQANYQEALSMKASLETLVGEKETALAEALAQVSELKEQQVVQKLQARKDKLSAVMATDKVEAVASSLQGLDDAAFEVVLGSYAAQAKAVEQSEMFNELGDAGAEAPAVVEKPKTNTTDELIKARLANR